VPADVVIEVQRPEVGGELVRYVLRVAVNLYRVAHNVQDGALLDTRADAVILEMHRNEHLDALPGGQALEIDVLRTVRHGVELHAADQGADRVGAGLDLVQARLPACLVDFLQDNAGVEGDQVGRLLSPIDDTRHLACPPSRPRCPLTCLRAYLGLDRRDVGHVRS
jgi:hypothetical protein